MSIGTVSHVTALAATGEPAASESSQAATQEVPVAYCSLDAHLSIVSILRAKDLLTIGSDSLRALPIDAHRRMHTEALDEPLGAILATALTPIAVAATAATTLGVIDPLDDIADTCAEHGVWIHFDGAYGL